MTLPRFYDLVFRDKDYAGEAEHVHRLVQERMPDARRLLDVACGTGRHLEHLARWYEVEGLDLDPAMLERARARLPDVPLHLGDMRDFDLDRAYDVVTCLFSAIGYAVTGDGLAGAIGAMARHLYGGGILLVEPWISPERCAPTSEPWIEVAEEPGRKLVVMKTSTLAGDRWVDDEHYLVWTAGGIEYLRLRGEQGAFTDRAVEDTFRGAGLYVEHDDVGLTGRGLFIGVAGRTAP